MAQAAVEREIVNTEGLLAQIEEEEVCIIIQYDCLK